MPAHSLCPVPGLVTQGRGRPDPLIEARLEALCAKGCRRVWGDIAALERGDPLPETRDLTPAEVRWLLAELKQVMAVYGARCLDL